MEAVHIFTLKNITKKEAKKIREGQQEAAKVWNLCMDYHKQVRAKKEKWPDRNIMQQMTKGKFQLHSQTIQMICHTFLANIETTKKVRKINYKMKYPYKEKIFYPLYWPEQAVSIEENRIVLPMGRGRASLILPKPKAMPDNIGSVKVIWNGLYYDFHAVLDKPVSEISPGDGRATVDLGQIHLAAVTTDNGKGLIVSGRYIRAEKRLLSKQLGEIAKLRSKCEKGSKRWRNLQRARRKVSLLVKRRVKDLRHKATRQVIDFCIEQKIGDLYIGDPHGVRKHKTGRKHNQRMSQWEYGKDIDYLTQKAQCAAISSFTGTERGTSSQCPNCGHKQRPNGRNWKCRVCGFEGHRDLVGSANQHLLAFEKKIKFPSLRDITYLRPGQKWRASGNKQPVVGSSSSLDTGQKEKSFLLSDGCQDVQPAPHRVSLKRQVESSCPNSEAHLL